MSIISCVILLFVGCVSSWILGVCSVERKIKAKLKKIECSRLMKFSDELIISVVSQALEMIKNEKVSDATELLEDFIERSEFALRDEL